MSIVSPWHMWGGEQIVKVTPGVPAATASRPTSIQIGRLNYRRPESWRFVFFAEPTEPFGVPALTADLTIQVNFNVQIGIGRSNWESAGVRGIDYDTLGPEQAFVKFVWFRAGGTALVRGGKKWATQARMPALDDKEVTPPLQVCDVIVGQDIQVACSVAAILNTGGGPVYDVGVRVGAFFAPNVHVRPDWHCESFADEMGGK